MAKAFAILKLESMLTDNVEAAIIVAAAVDDAEAAIIAVAAADDAEAAIIAVEAKSKNS